MSTKTWKQYAHSHINKVTLANPDVTEEKALRKLLRDNYPFGVRQYHPYKQWCKAVNEHIAERQKPSVCDTPAEDTKPVYSVADYADTPLFQEVTA